MTKTGILMLSVAMLLTLTSISCKKKEVDEVEVQPTKGRFRVITKALMSSGGSAVPFAKWSLSAMQKDLFFGRYFEEGITDAGGTDTTSELDPGRYHFTAIGALNGDSIDGIATPVELKAGNMPQDVLLELYN